MAESDEESSDVNNLNNLTNNLDLIYEYTASILKAFDEDAKAINAKLGTIIAFSGFGALFPSLVDVITNEEQLKCIDRYSSFF